MTKICESASQLPARYRKLAEYFATPHSLIYEPLDLFYDYLREQRLGEDRKKHNTATGCACMVCRAKAGHTPRYVRALLGTAEPDWILWGDHHLATDGQGHPITRTSPCVGKARDGCPCCWCRPYHHEQSMTNRQALRQLLDFIGPMVPVVRGRRLEGEKAALQARLADVQEALATTVYQPTLEA